MFERSGIDLPGPPNRAGTAVQPYCCTARGLHLPHLPGRLLREVKLPPENLITSGMQYDVALRGAFHVMRRAEQDANLIGPWSSLCAVKGGHCGAHQQDPNYRDGLGVFCQFPDRTQDDTASQRVAYELHLQALIFGDDIPQILAKLNT